MKYTSKDFITAFIGTWLPLGLLSATTWFGISGLETITTIYYVLIVLVMIFAVNAIPAFNKKNLEEYQTNVLKHQKWRYYAGGLITGFQIYTMFAFGWYTLAVLFLALAAIIYYHVSVAFSTQTEKV